MDNVKAKIDKIQEFINNYFKYSQTKGRERMYGSLEQLESNWRLLDNFFFILNNLEDREREINYTQYLITRDFGARSAAMVIKKKKVKNPYAELTKIWKKYEKWRERKISELHTHST